MITYAGCVPAHVFVAESSQQVDAGFGWNLISSIDRLLGRAIVLPESPSISHWTPPNLFRADDSGFVVKTGKSPHEYVHKKTCYK